MNEYIGLLLHSRTQAHVYHLQTTSYSSHIALQEYYEAIVPLVDEVVEAYQGKYGILTGYGISSTIKELSSEVQILEYFQWLSRVVSAHREDLPKDDYLEDFYNDIEAVIHTTTYKLRFLK